MGDISESQRTTIRSTTGKKFSPLFGIGLSTGRPKPPMRRKPDPEDDEGDAQDFVPFDYVLKPESGLASETSASTEYCDAPSSYPQPEVITRAGAGDKFDSMSIKQLKTYLEDLGVKHSDCFEKSELQAKARQYAEKATQKANSPKVARPAPKESTCVEDAPQEAQVEFVYDTEKVKRGRSKKDDKCLCYAPPVVPRSKAQAVICQRCFHPNVAHVDLDNQKEVDEYYYV